MESQHSQDTKRAMESQLGQVGNRSQFDGQFSTFKNHRQEEFTSEFGRGPSETAGMNGLNASMDPQLQPASGANKGSSGYPFQALSSDPALPRGQVNTQSNERSVFEVEQEELAYRGISGIQPHISSQAGALGIGSSFQPVRSGIQGSGSQIGTASALEASKLQKKAVSKEQDLMRALNFAQKVLQYANNPYCGMPEALIDELQPPTNPEPVPSTSKLASTRLMKSSQQKHQLEHSKLSKQASQSREQESQDFEDLRRMAGTDSHQLEALPGSDRSFKGDNLVIAVDPFAELEPFGQNHVRTSADVTYIDPRSFFKQPTMQFPEKSAKLVTKVHSSTKFLKTQTSDRGQNASTVSVRSPLKRLYIDNEVPSVQKQQVTKRSSSPLHHYEQATTSSQKKRPEPFTSGKTETKSVNKHWSYPRFGNLKKPPAALICSMKGSQTTTGSLSEVEQMHQALMAAQASEAERNYQLLFGDRMRSNTTQQEPSLLDYYATVHPTPHKIKTPLIHINLVEKSSRRSPRNLETGHKHNSGWYGPQPKRSRSPKPTTSARQLKLEPNIDRLAAQIYTELRDVFH